MFIYIYIVYVYTTYIYTNITYIYYIYYIYNVYTYIYIYIYYISFSHPNKFTRKLKIVEIKLLAQRYILSKWGNCNSNSFGLMVKPLLFSSIQFTFPTSNKGQGSLCIKLQIQTWHRRSLIQTTQISQPLTHIPVVLKLCWTVEWLCFFFLLFKKKFPMPKVLLNHLNMHLWGWDQGFSTFKPP